MALKHSADIDYCVLLEEWLTNCSEQCYVVLIEQVINGYSDSPQSYRQLRS